MKTKVLLIMALVFAAGCDDRKFMTRAEVIAACKECEAAGMDYEVIENGFVHRPKDVNCVPRTKP